MGKDITLEVLYELAAAGDPAALRTLLVALNGGQGWQTAVVAEYLASLLMARDAAGDELLTTEQVRLVEAAVTAWTPDQWQQDAAQMRLRSNLRMRLDAMSEGW